MMELVGMNRGGLGFRRGEDMGLVGEGGFGSRAEEGRAATWGSYRRCWRLCSKACRRGL